MGETWLPLSYEETSRKQNNNRKQTDTSRRMERNWSYEYSRTRESGFRSRGQGRLLGAVRHELRAEKRRAVGESPI